MISYRGRNVLGIIGSGFNRLEVADGINVVVTHQYGKQCMSFATNSYTVCVCCNHWSGPTYYYCSNAHMHTKEGNAFFQIQVSNGSLLETCGLCGNLNGQLLQRDGKIARFTDVAQVDAFTQSYLVEPRLQSLRPQRRECGEHYVVQVYVYSICIVRPFGIRSILYFRCRISMHNIQCSGRVQILIL